MNYLLLSILFFFQSGWVVYNSENPSFVISFPSKVQEKEKLIKSEIGDIEIHTLYAVSSVDSSENNIYLMNYYKMDPNIFIGDSTITKEEFFDETIDNIAKELSSKIIYSNSSINDKTSFAIYRLENEKTAMKGKLVLTAGYFFSLQVFTDKQYALNTNMDKFLDSFYVNISAKK